MRQTRLGWPVPLRRKETGQSVDFAARNGADLCESEPDLKSVNTTTKILQKKSENFFFGTTVPTCPR